MAFQTEHISNIPAYIFGEESSLVEQMHSVVAAENGVQVWFLGVVVAAAALYLFWLNYWSMKGKMHSTFLGLFGDMRSDFFEKLEELPPSFGLYVAWGSMMGVVAISIAVTAVVKISVDQTLQHYSLVMVAIVAIYVFKLLVLAIAGWLTAQPNFFTLLQKISNGCLTVVGMTTLPTILCYSLCRGMLQDAFMYIAGFQLLVALCMFFHKTFMLFLSKKVSVLHTILYLCAVEIFPITLIWGFFYR
ncbi:MAG: DUF4271 domain-containing protein [Rikenellaceae bacterium]